MTTYQKRPETVEAFQMTEERFRDCTDWPEWLNAAWQADIGEEGSLYRYPGKRTEDMARRMYLVVQGDVRGICKNDWIIRHASGKLEICYPNNFKAIYRLVVSETEKEDN